MKILHTADIHLKNYGDERWETLVSLLSIAREQNVGAVVISGDLFDKDLDAENLRPNIRDVFSGNRFPVLIIPGNHDAQLMADMYFGSDAVVISDLTEPYIIDDVAFYGLPFESMDEHRVLERLHILKNHLSDETRNVLLYHGELLDVMFKQSDIGGESETGYMPVRLSYFTDLNIGYVLAGHFHTRFDVRRLPGGGYFIYSGSPVSITRRETGQRKVNLFSVGEPPAEYPVDSPHYEELVHTFDPLDDSDPVRAIETKLDNIHPRARVLVTVNGYYNRNMVGTSEKEMARQITSLVRSRGFDPPELTFRDIQHILEDDLFTAFMFKLDTYDLDTEKRQRIREHAIRAMIEAKQ